MFQLSESQLVSLLEDISERTQKKTTVKVLFIMILNVSTCMAGDTTFWILLHPVLLLPPSCKPGFDFTHWLLGVTPGP